MVKDKSATANIDEVKTLRMVLDSMIVHQIINDKETEKIIEYIKKSSNSKIMVIDRILNETINMEEKEYGRKHTQNSIINKIAKVGEVKTFNVNHAAPSMIRAREIADSKKYVNDKGIGLSYTDCILLILHVERFANVMTRDKLLIRAAESEGRKIIPF